MRGNLIHDNDHGVSVAGNSDVRLERNVITRSLFEAVVVYDSSRSTLIGNTFVKNGGGLFIISDHDNSDRNNDGWDSPHIWNDLFTSNGTQNNPFGMSFDYKDISETSTNIVSLPGDSVLHGSYGNVSQVKWTGGTSITISPTSNSTVKGVVYTSGSSHGNSNVMVAHCYYGKGKVVAVADSSPPDDGTGDVNDVLYNGYTADANGNHRILLMNSIIWLATNSSILPVNFISFTGNRSGTANILQWTAGDVASVLKFEIESSIDGLFFYKKYEMAAHFNQSSYTWSESLANNAAVYYRIKAIQLSGEEIYSQVIAIKGGESKLLFTVSPNPVKDAAKIFFSNTGGGTLKLYNQQSVVLLTKKISSGTQQYILDVASFSPGVYYLSYTSEGKKSVEKVLIER